MLQMMGVFAEFERAMIRERVIAGLARARSDGKQLGRKRLEDSDPKDPLKVEVEIEVICRGCGYHLVRTVARLRRDTPVVCANCGEQIVLPQRPSMPPSAGKG